MRTALGFLVLLGVSLGLYGPLADFRYWPVALLVLGWVAFMAFMAARN